MEFYRVGPLGRPVDKLPYGPVVPWTSRGEIPYGSVTRGSRGPVGRVSRMVPYGPVARPVWTHFSRESRGP